MSQINIHELQQKRDAAKLAALASPLQPEIEALRDQIVAAKKAKKTERVAELTEMRNELIARRDTEVTSLSALFADAKRSEREAQRAQDAERYRETETKQLDTQIAETSATISELRRKMKAMVAESSRRARQVETKALLGRLSPQEKSTLKAALASE